MEDSEVDLDVPDSGSSVLQDLATNETSLLRLLVTLLSPKTLPHIGLIAALSTVLFVLAGNESLKDFSALGFLSLAGGYAITGLFSSNERVRKWTHVSSKEDQEKKTSIVFQTLSTFKICMFPLAMAGLVAVMMVLLLRSDDSLLPDYIPFLLGTMFVVWAVAQGRSFSTWASSVAAKKLPEKQRIDGKLTPHLFFQGAIILLFSVIGILVFSPLDSDNSTGASALLDQAVFLVLALLLFGITVAMTYQYRTMAWRDRSLKKFASRWTMFAQLFATWHLLTIWRQTFMQQSTIEVFIEEVILMILTVFMAIWSITSKSVAKHVKLLNTENALPWGLAFGYAYAGSVAMLANEFSSITNVMIAGHMIAIITVTLMQRSVLKRVLENHNITVEIERISNAISPTESLPQVVFDEVRDHPAKGDEETPVPEDSEWDNETPDAIDKTIQWDDVIDLDG